MTTRQKSVNSFVPIPVNNFLNKHKFRVGTYRTTQYRAVSRIFHHLFKQEQMTRP